MPIEDATPVLAEVQRPAPQPHVAPPGGDHISCAPDFDVRRCKALMRVLTSIIWVTDEAGRFVTPQASWSSYTGQSWTEQAGVGWLEAVHPDDREDVRAALMAARQHRRVYFASGRLWNAATRSYRRVEARGAPILDDDGELKEWVGTCKDVEDMVSAEQMLRESDRRKDEFIAVLAHELRNPLAPIRNAVQILKLRGNADMQLGWARSVIDRQVGQMAHLLDDLLDVSRITRNKIELKKSRVALDSVLETAIEGSRPLWERQGQHFELNALAEPIHLDADPARLAQAFTNLLTNAAKYTDRGGTISLTVRQEGGLAVVTIKDNGIGISPGMLPRLFDLFSQAPAVLERSQGGLGLGLSIVRALVQMHGGTVEADSPGPGQGSTFTVKLPAAPRLDGPAPVLPPRACNGKRLRVLVADDNVDAAETTSVLLEMLGHEVQVARDGEEAVRLAASFAADVALLDIGMPRCNGYEAAARLRADHPGMALVAVTGWGQIDDMRRAADAGFDRHLIKPVDPEQLMELLAHVHPTGGGPARTRGPA